MPTLAWDEVGERVFQAGVDRGVLYLDGEAIAWNGLTSLEEVSTVEVNSYYQDGVKYLDHQVMGDFAATLKAFTYPDEFEACIGTQSRGHGLFFHDQPPKAFGLSYRTKLGNDLLGVDLGYMIHLAYNLRAVPSNNAYETLAAEVAPVEFSWALTSTPEFVTGYRPTSHISFKSTDLDFGVLQQIEDMLYGTDIDVPYLPSLAEIVDTIDNPVIIIDNGDGTWTATGSANAVSLLSPTTFKVTGIPVHYVDSDTWQIETTAP